MNCLKCGETAAIATAKFCGSCGERFVHQASASILSRGSSQPNDSNTFNSIKKYLLAIEEIVFDIDSTPQVVANLSGRLCEKFQITRECEESLLAALNEKKAEIKSFFSIKVEFDENVLDAFAGHDTHLRFRITNTSSDDYYKVRMNWDDPETADDQDLVVVVPSLIKPGQSVIAGGTHIFPRSGPKEVSGLRLDVENQYLESAAFVAAPFSFRVGNIDQKVYKSISTNNSISIEGRGVIDASGIGGGASSERSLESDCPRWVRLHYKYSLSTKLEVIAEKISRVYANAATAESKETELVGRTMRDEVAPIIVPIPVAPPVVVEAIEYQGQSSLSNREASSRHERVDRFCQSLGKLVDFLDSSERDRLVPAPLLPLAVFDWLVSVVGSEIAGDVVWVAFEQISVARGVIAGGGVDSAARCSLITQSGIVSVDGSGSDPRRFCWHEFAPDGHTMYVQMIGTAAIALSIGEEKSKSFFPGLRFDLRGYRGDQPIDSLIGELKRQFFLISVSVETLVSEFKQIEHGLGVYSIDSAPGKVLRTALYSLGEDVTRDDILLIIDSSKIYGPGTDGLVVTADGLYVWNNRQAAPRDNKPGSHNKRVLFEAIESVDCQVVGLNSWLKLNGSKFFTSDRISTSALQAIAAVLSKFVRARAVGGAC